MKNKEIRLLKSSHSNLSIVIKLVERKYIYLIKGFFPEGITAGFTKPCITGKIPEDIKFIYSSLNKTFSFGYLTQPHSTQVKNIVREGLYAADALFTGKNKLALIAKTADCLPLFFYSKHLRIIGILHMGWRSANKGILDSIPYDMSLFRAVAGVGLRKCCFKVGREFTGFKKLNHFVKKNNDLHFDPVEFSAASLKKKGLRENNFKDLRICTFCNNHNFPSYRRDKTNRRTLSFILQE